MPRPVWPPRLAALTDLQDKPGGLGTDLSNMGQIKISIVIREGKVEASMLLNKYCVYFPGRNIHTKEVRECFCCLRSGCLKPWTELRKGCPLFSCGVGRNAPAKNKPTLFRNSSYVEARFLYGGSIGCKREVVR